MLRTTLLALPVLLAIGTPADAQVRLDAVMIRQPDVSREEIAFGYDGDIWLVDKRGGTARRISSPAGAEGFPRFSPDGQRLALTGGYEGGGDLYVLDPDGGLPQRVTYHPGGEILCDWHPDGERLIFQSTRTSGSGRAAELFTIPAAGGAAEKLPVPYGAFGAIDETGTWLAYTLTSREFRTWKRYQGGRAQDIWLFNLKTHESRKLTDHPGTDALPMWHGGSLIFLSDRGDNHRLNLWSHDLENGSTRRLTDFAEWDVKFPSIGPEDVVFENGGKLYRFELASRRSVAVEVIIPGDRRSLRPRTLELEGQVADLDVSPNAKRVVVEARGELFTVPVEEGFVRSLTRTSGVAEREPAWSPDGRWIACFSDKSGEYELWIRRSDGAPFAWPPGSGGEEVSEKRITEIGEGWKSRPHWSPDSKMLTFQNSDGSLNLLHLASGEVEVLERSKDGAPASSWSADSAWLCWSQPIEGTQNEGIYLYELASKELHLVTSPLFSNGGPAFDRGGDWLYYTSGRDFRSTYSDFDETWVYTDSHRLVAVPLREDVENPWAVENDEEEIEEEEAEEEEAEEEEAEEPEGEEESAEEEGSEEDEAGEEAAEEDEEADDEDEEEAEEPLQIDLEGFEARAILLPGAGDGRIGGVQAADGKVLYLKVSRERRGGSTLCFYDMEEKEEKTILEGVRGYGLVGEGKKVLVRTSGDWAVIDLKPDQKVKDTIDLSQLASTIDPRAEWEQIVYDAWRFMRDLFYDEGLHQVDWTAVRDRYLSGLRDATSRGDVHYLIGEMIAELNVGHAYNRPPREGMEEPPSGRRAGLLGCDWSLEQGAWRIAGIIGGADYDYDARGPLQALGIDVREGDWLLEVNDQPVDPTREVHAAFLGTAGQPTRLTLNARPELDGEERRVLVEPVSSERSLRYRDWVARNRERVDQLSGGRVGYVHVPDTGRSGQNELVRQYSGQYFKDAILIDERWNAGGQIPTRFIELLNRPLTNFWATRIGEDAWPPRAHQGPKAMLINESAGSGGDCFPYYFKQAGLGKLIGTRTWGGLVGISGGPSFVDGGGITIPRFAFFELDGTWGVEGWGVDPDIEVVDDPALMVDGGDPQLEAGVKHLLEELQGWKPADMTRPAGPDRRGAGVTPEDH